MAIQLSQEAKDFISHDLKPYLKKNDWVNIRKKISTDFRNIYGTMEAQDIYAFFLEHDLPMFYGMKKIPDSMFAQSSVTKVKIPGYVKVIGKNAFSGCENLTTVIIEDGVERILNSAFRSSAISTLVLPESVQEIGSYTFADTNLQKINIPNATTDLLENTFMNCPNNLVIYANSRKELPAPYKLRVPSEEVDFYKKHIKMKGEE